MIFQYELTRVKMVCDYTNALLEFEADNSVRNRFIDELQRGIELIKHNLFGDVSLDPSYLEFNRVMTRCIDCLTQKIDSVRRGEAFWEFVTFDPSFYADRLVKAE